MPFTRPGDALGVVAMLIPEPYRLEFESTRQEDLGYFADFYRGSDLLTRLEIYPYIVVGPGPHRPPDERRVQLELSRRAENIVRDPPPGRTGVMLGLRDHDIDGETEATALIVAFSFGIYRQMTSRSSLQFPEDILLEAELFGAAAFAKTSIALGSPLRAITLAMRPSVLPLFFVELAGHFTQPANWDALAVSQVQETARNYYNVDSGIQRLAISPVAASASEEPMIANESRRRRIAARVVMQPLRYWRFAEGVQRAYGYRCAACDIQLELVEAAHIDPVENLDSSDDVSNGLALCALHHKAYDQGLLEIDAGGAIKVSRQKLDELASKMRDGGHEAFTTALRPRIRLPEDERLRPRAEHFDRRDRFRRSNA